MKTLTSATTCLLAALSAPVLLAQDTKTKAESEKIIRESSTVLSEILNAKDQSIPRDLLSKARCVGIVPGLKRAGLIVGGEYGKGVVTCQEAGMWSAPSIIRIEGGNIGLQIGAGETDVVFVIMNQTGMDRLMEDKFTIGAGAAAMAGPVGRATSAQTDAALRAEILSYSRSRGVFAGATLNGATMRPDQDDNRALYGREITQREILTGKIPVPVAARPLIDTIRRNATPQG